MPITTFQISEKQRDQLLFREESHFCDLKSREIAPGKLTKSIAAFANADGGELFIGISEDKTTGVRTWTGFESLEAANGHIQPFEKLFPLGTDFDYSFLYCESAPGLVLQVQIRKTQEIKRATDGEVYLRRGAQNLPINTTEGLRHLEYTKGLASFENELVDVPIDIIENSLPTLEFMLGVVPAAEPGPWLAKQWLIRNGKPTVAGLLLFAESPQAILAKRSGIKIYRHKTREAEGTRETLAFTPITIEGNLYSQIHAAVSRTTAVVEDIKRLGEETLEQVQYPSEALHEIITNAVLHRDYSIADDIHIRIFDNRVDVESPGRFPAHITVENILAERFSRNGTIVRIINKFPDPPNQDVGEGLNTAFAAMRQIGLKPPRIEERPNSVLVSLKHEPLASPEQLILEFLEKNDSIRNRQARDICNIGADYIIKRIFGLLGDRGLIEQIPGTDRSTTAYRRGRNFSSWRNEPPQ
ncbi:Divergent AAA domain protein [Planctopirus ephydatiae]|uniref:Divergent AAA domain protein n=1 Tax=Planctopirus ephydatiae TaxID=2528019 RepID=A0A518GTV5_9PLAN|nr:ATP-binding protein [Planctopirus ephydatiae]QDV31999.1 Divergent AAA domain protein [Planctopirus ephydatiae]